jgi:hypothetical protein
VTNFFTPCTGLEGIQGWRIYVLDTVLGALVTFGALVAIPCIVMLIIQGLWPAVISDLVILGMGAALWRNNTASFRFRSLGLCIILYLLGLALIFVLAPTSQIYLITSPALGAIPLGTRPAIWILLGNSITLFCVG